MESVNITAREIYDAVIKLTAKVDVLIEQYAMQNEKLKDHETRIRSLERARWPLPSLAVLASLAAFVTAFLQKFRL